MAPAVDGATATPSFASRAGGRDTAHRLLDDMRMSLQRCRNTGEMLPCTPAQLRGFVERARAGLPRFSFAHNAEVFYWLGKCAQGSGDELDDELLMAYTQHIRSQALSVDNETKLVRILRSFLEILNRNKIAASIDTDVQRQMEAASHELLAASLPRLCSRHRHLNFMDLTVMLSVYVKMLRPEYLRLFEALVPDALARVASPIETWSLEREHEFLQHGPFLLMAYAQARCVHEGIFDTYLELLEAKMRELPYETLAIMAYSVSLAGIDRPSLWSGMERLIAAEGAEWSMRAVGRIMGSCRRMFAPGPQHSRRQSDDGAVLGLMRTAGRAMLQRRGDVQFHEASDLVMALAVLPPGAGLTGPEVSDLLRLSCEVAERSAAEFPPSYLASGFHAFVALLLHRLRLGAEAAEDAALALRGLRALAPELRVRMFLYLVQDMEYIGEALWALLGHGPLALAWELGADRFFLVQQREVVRKAHELGPARTARLARLAAETAVAFGARGELAPVRVDGQRGLLRPWFLPEALAYCQRAQSEEVLAHCQRAAGGTATGSPLLLRLEPERLAWLSEAAAADELGLPACARKHAWLRLDEQRGEAARGSALDFAYGGCPA